MLVNIEYIAHLYAYLKNIEKDSNKILKLTYWTVVTSWTTNTLCLSCHVGIGASFTFPTEL